MKFANEDFHLGIILEQNILQCCIIPNIKLMDNIQYAYYLLKDGERVDTIWYSNKPTVKFELINEGKYSAICFVKVEEEITTYKTDYLQYYVTNCEIQSGKEIIHNNSISFDIWGSCVSRDIFSFDKSLAYNVNNYIARNSIISALSPKVEFEYDDIDLGSKFQRDQVINDLAKTSFEKLANNKSDYLIIDFIDERFKLALYDGSIITLSNEMILSGIIKKPTIIHRMKKKKWGLKIRRNVSQKTLIGYIDLFCKNINDIYSQDKIIIHRAFMCDDFINKSGNKVKFKKNYLKNNEEVNQLLRLMYDRVIYNFCDAHILDSNGRYVASETHKWGLSTMHYQDEYYLGALHELKGIITKSI